MSARDVQREGYIAENSHVSMVNQDSECRISWRGSEAAVAASVVESDGAAAAAHDGLSGCAAVAAQSLGHWRTQADLDDQLDALMGEALMDMHWKRMRKRAAEEKAKKEAEEKLNHEAADEAKSKKEADVNAKKDAWVSAPTLASAWPKLGPNLSGPNMILTLHPTATRPRPGRSLAAS